MFKIYKKNFRVLVRHLAQKDHASEIGLSIFKNHLGVTVVCTMMYCLCCSPGRCLCLHET